MRISNDLNRYINRIVLWLLLSSAAFAVHAGDEDMNPTAYQRFDPETGFMVPIDTPPSSQHQPTNANASTAASQATPPGNEAAAATANIPAMTRPQSSTDEQTPSAPWTAIIIGVIALGLIVTLLRKRKPNTESRLD